MRPNGIRLGCCASLGSPYGFGGFRTYCDTIVEHSAGWTRDELGEMVRRVKNCGFEEVIPWTDYPPGEILPADPESAPLAVVDAKASFLKRVESFVDLAHAEGVRVQLYFAIGTGLMAARKTHQDGTQRLHVNELGATYPQCATRDRQGRSSLDLVRGGEEELAFASLGFPEVQRWIAEWVVGMVAATGADGVQLEPVSTRLDESGVRPHGYDEPIISSFKRRCGRDPRSLPNDDREWVDHRCEFTTQMLREVRRRVDDLGRPVELSVQCHNLRTDSAKFFWPWRVWVEENFVDACYLKSPARQGFREALVEGRQWCEAHGVRFCGILDMKRYSAFLTPEAIADGVREMLASGVAQATIYGLAFTSLARNPAEAPVERWLAARKLLSKELCVE